MSSAESLARAEEKNSREVEAPRGTRVTDDPAGRGSPGGGLAALLHLQQQQPLQQEVLEGSSLCKSPRGLGRKDETVGTRNFALAVCAGFSHTSFCIIVSSLFASLK